MMISNLRLEVRTSAPCGLALHSRPSLATQASATNKSACFRTHGHRIFMQRPTSKLSRPGAYGLDKSANQRANSLLCRCKTGTDNQPQLSRESIKDALQVAARSEGGYLLKLFIVSAIGAALVKFGSLASSTPFQPSSIIALSIITVPCLLYSLLLLQKGD